MIGPLQMPSTTSEKLQALLDRINGKRTLRTSYDDMVWRDQQRIEDEQVWDTPPLSADDWGRFKYRFLETYGGEEVQSTGMTHSEFLRYLETSGYREGAEFENRRFYEIWYSLQL
jgi:hypothetical protein